MGRAGHLSSATTTKEDIVPQGVETTGLVEEFDLADLNLSTLTVVSMHDSAGQSGPVIASAGSSCCSCTWHESM